MQRHRDVVHAAATLRLLRAVVYQGKADKGRPPLGRSDRTAALAISSGVLMKW
jgi:hypothetical protein